jgi:hypothetical protein
MCVTPHTFTCMCVTPHTFTCVTPHTFTCMCTPHTFTCVHRTHSHVCVHRTHSHVSHRTHSHVCVHRTHSHSCVHRTHSHVYTAHIHMYVYTALIHRNCSAQEPSHTNSHPRHSVTRAFPLAIHAYPVSPFLHAPMLSCLLCVCVCVCVCVCDDGGTLAAVQVYHGGKASVRGCTARAHNVFLSIARASQVTVAHSVLHSPKWG